ncbi:relaxase [Sphingobacterium cellulitidis]|uniref:relaxase/mobilization nuclease domain-containing protein n=1 Tax=Sphingobacterium cellulitidis TaxID=1768011 RepID=UPI000B93BC77|nr:relaxase/mobilization nuclease domain-containing protein [Sphingobacterium cellulitidis]OYD46352.1 relaxase [Sphingobacterium cellulitidis]
MVAKIISGKSIRGILHYNEGKVAAKEAKLILSSGMGMNITKMGFEDKLQRFNTLTMLNPKTKTNALHITLNFDAQDRLDDAKLQQIAMDYMERIGFGEQPYLVYKHTDAAHAHVHIATTNMKVDGSRIDIHGIGRSLSEPARKDIEKQYGLVQAEGRQASNALGIKPADIEKAVYGKSLTKRSITNIVNAVIRTYKFTSLAEMNAVLRQFNVTADRGGENTAMYQKNGLQYSIVDQNGEKVGIPINASTIYNKPTLANLEEKFQQGKEKRRPYKEPLKAAIDAIFAKYADITKATFIRKLEELNIHAAFRTNEQGFTYGVTFVDSRHRTVFNGSDLGKTYSAKAITERFGTTDRLMQPEQKTYLTPRKQTGYLKKGPPGKTYLKAPVPSPHLKGMLDKTYMDYSLGIPRRRKKKKRNPEQDQQQEQSL